MAELIFELNLTWFQKQGTFQIAVNLKWTNNVGMPLAWHEIERLMGREDGGGFKMGNTCIPVADSC